MQINGADHNMMSGGVMLSGVITQVIFYWFTLNDKLVLIYYAPNPIELHVHCFGLELLDYYGCYSQCS